MSHCIRPLGLAATALVAFGGLPASPTYADEFRAIPTVITPLPGTTARTTARAGTHRLWNGDPTGPDSNAAPAPTAPAAPAGQATDSASARLQRKAKRKQKRRRAWCKRYRAIVQNRADFQTLPFVKQFWGYGLALAEINSQFLAFKKTDKHYLYEAWKRHRHHIRSAEFDRKKGRSRYREYTGEIMNEPEILALGHQLTQIRNNMVADGQKAQFRELLQVLLDARRSVQATYHDDRARRHLSRVSRYHPDPSEMEGGCTDRKSLPLFTLDQYLSGRAPYVSIALDRRLYSRGKISYGDEFRIPELDTRYRDALGRVNREYIVFRAVDTGAGFTGKGFSRLDLCVTSKSYARRYKNGGKSLGRVSLVQLSRTLTLGARIDGDSDTTDRRSDRRSASAR